MNTSPHADKPIGIFDSGIGGLTVAGAIRKVLPREQIIYFGDTAHLPYGEKSQNSIRHYTRHIARFLAARECKMIVIACNTASAVAYSTVLEEFGHAIPILNVIDPVAEYTGAHFQDHHIGVIATRTTVKSGIYEERIKAHNPSLTVHSLAAPLLVTMIEEGFFNNTISQTIIDSYLHHKTLQNIDALILGCTHFPLIKREVANYYQNKVEIIDSAGIVASKADQLLGAQNLHRTNETAGESFFLSEYTDSFAESARMFFGSEVHLSEYNIWS